MKPSPTPSSSLSLLMPSSLLLLPSLILPCHAFSLFQPPHQLPPSLSSQTLPRALLHQLLPIAPSNLSPEREVSPQDNGLLQPVSERPASPDTTDLIDQLSHNIPACALDCVVELTNITTECLDDNNGTGDPACWCSDDVNHYTRVLSCVQKKCTMEESIETARGAWEACGKPQRSRKIHLLAPLSIELLALVCVLLRLYSRWWTGGKFEADDWVMMVVVALYIAFETIGCTAATTAFGVDIWTVDASALGTSLKLFYMGETFYLVILALTKISILCFYLRIFPQPTFRIITFIVMAWVALSGVIFVFAQIFQCVPLPYIWEGWRKGKFGPFTCLDINTLGYTTAAFSIAQDIVILVMPLPLLMNLNVSLRSKIGIIVMFSLGIFVLITSCVRLWALYDFGDSVNPTWDYTDALIWTGLEVGVSIIVTSLPAIRVLLSRRGGNLLGGSRSTASAMRGALGSRTTSSFGNTTTVVASWHTMPPHLRRISSVSRISSIKVGDETPTDVERQGRGLEVMDLDGDKPDQEFMLTGGNGGPEKKLRRPWSNVSVGNSTVVGSESDFEGSGDRDSGWPLNNKAVLAGAGGGTGGQGQRLSHMPSIDEILTYGGGGQERGVTTHGSQGSRLSNKRSCDSEGPGYSLSTSSCGGSTSWNGSGSGSVMSGDDGRESRNGEGSRSGSGSGSYSEGDTVLDRES